MAELPLQRKLFPAFLGLHEGVRPIVLPEVYSSGGSQNVYVDKFGRIKVVLGFAKRNSSETTSDTGGTSGPITGLFSYRSSTSSEVSHLLKVLDGASSEWEVWRSTNDGSSWTFALEGATAAGTLADFSQLGNECVIAGPDDGPYNYDGTNVAVIAPTQSPTVSASTTGTGVLNGTKQYKLLSVILDARQKGAVASTAVAFENQNASLTWTADVNTNVTGYELYATTGTGKVFYFVTYIDARLTASYTDVMADTVLVTHRVMEEHGDAPPSGVRFCESHLQRMWYARVDGAKDNTRSLWYSDVGDAFSVYAENKFTLTDEDSAGDHITGLLGGFKESLLVFMENGIWRVTGTGQVFGDQSDWAAQRSSARVGAVSHRAFQKVPPGSVYLDQFGKQHVTSGATVAYLTPYNDIRLFDGEADTIISFPVEGTLASTIYQYRGKSFSYIDQQRNEIVWVFVGVNGSAHPDTAVAWSLTYGAWFVRTLFWAASAVEHREGGASGNNYVLLGGSGAGDLTQPHEGFVYENWSGTAFGSNAITGIWMTGALYGFTEDRIERSADKRWRWIDLSTAGATSTTFTVSWLLGDAADDGSTQGSTSGTGASLMRIKMRTSATNDYLHSTGVRLKIQAGSTNDQWAIESLELAYQVLPGLHRRQQ